MDKINISAVAYTNTKPFIYGLEHSPIIDKINLSLDIPTDCARKLIDGTVDIGLIPVAAIPQVKGANVISDYCIGSDGAVNSVFVFSHKPIYNIENLMLDPQSKTSNSLAKILLRFYWNKEVEFLADETLSADAIVLIGDRTFDAKKDFKYAYDLGEEWKSFTGLPFIYAAWVANKKINDEFKVEFNNALRFGLDNRDKVLEDLPKNSVFDFSDYLMNRLQFELTPDRVKALDLFLHYVEKLETSLV